MILAGAILLGEKHIAILIALKGRIQVDQVDSATLKVAAEDVQVVTVVKQVVSHVQP
jgi:hypothetical protein